MLCRVIRHIFSYNDRTRFVGENPTQLIPHPRVSASTSRVLVKWSGNTRSEGGRSPVVAYRTVGPAMMNNCSLSCNAGLIAVVSSATAARWLRVRISRSGNWAQTKASMIATIAKILRNLLKLKNGTASKQRNGSNSRNNVHTDRQVPRLKSYQPK